MNTHRRWAWGIRAAALCVWAGAAPGQGPRQVAYVDASEPDEAVVRTWQGGRWDVRTEHRHGRRDVEAVRTLLSGVDDRACVLTLDSSGRLRVREIRDGRWRGSQSVNNRTGSTAPGSFDGFYERESGDLVVVSRARSDRRLRVRVFEARRRWGEQRFDVGLTSPVLRLKALTRGSGDEALIVVATARELVAARWDGDDIVGATVLDDRYDGGAERFDAAYTAGGGSWTVAWARAGEATVRTRRLAGATWQGEQAGPDAAGSIDRLVLAGSVAGSGRRLALALGVDGTRVVASLHNGSAWTPATELESAARDAAAMGVGFDRDDTATFAWQRAGETHVVTRTHDGRVFSEAVEGPDSGGQINAIELAALDDADGVHLIARAGLGAGVAGYAAYSERGRLSLSGVTINGHVGGAEPGVDLPVPESPDHGTENLRVHGGTERVAGTRYRNVELSHDTTLVFSEERYVFRRFAPARNRTTLRFETEDHGIEVSIVDGHFVARDDLRIETTGPHPVTFHVVDGNFSARHDAVVNARILVYDGVISLRNDAQVVGQLLASGEIRISSGTLTASGDLLEREQGPHTWTLLATTFANGSFDETHVLSNDWRDDGGAPFTLSSSPAVPASGTGGGHGLRVSSWREISPTDD